MATLLFKPPVGSIEWFHLTRSKAASEDIIISTRIMMAPALAAELLRRNPDNRGVRPSKVQQLVSDIQQGRWTFNGEPILISKEGELNDGQHRCSAVVEANVPIEVMMIFGLDRETRMTVDQGAARGAGDFMMMSGVTNATAAASILRYLIAYEQAAGQSLGNTSAVSNMEITERYYAEPQIAVSATFVATLHKYYKRIATPQIIGFCHVLFTRISPVDADTFLRQVCVGENIRKKDAAFATRLGLERDRVTATEKVHLIFRGWNAFRRKRPDVAHVRVTGNLPALI